MMPKKSKPDAHKLFEMQLEISDCLLTADNELELNKQTNEETANEANPNNDGKEESDKQ